MSEPRWYHSLYWRIALGLFAFLAMMLAAQGALFLWITDRIAGSMPARDPRRLAVLVASDVGAALSADPALDLKAYVAEQYSNVFQTFLVIMQDGRVAANHDDLSDDVVKEMIAETERPFPLRGRRFGPGPPPPSPGFGGPGPKRLRHVQDAAERLGGGDLTARVPAEGGDEVAAVARSFNRMAEELTARAEALAASDRARRQLLADVSHELMTPLTAMRGYVETLSMPELKIDEETSRRYLAIVTEETHRLEHIIGDLLDLARLEGGGGTMRRETVDVAWLFERVAARHERELRERGITLVQNVGSDATQVIGDPDRLEQALQNLAANALKHVD